MKRFLVMHNYGQYDGGWRVVAEADTEDEVATAAMEMATAAMTVEIYGHSWMIVERRDIWLKPKKVA